MSTITINIGKDDAMAVTPASGMATETAAFDSADGGSPKFSDSATAPSDQQDIGGPPTWLSEILSNGKEKQQGETTPGAEESGDGGAAKVTLN